MDQIPIDADLTEVHGLFANILVKVSVHAMRLAGRKA